MEGKKGKRNIMRKRDKKHKPFSQIYINSISSVIWQMWKRITQNMEVYQRFPHSFFLPFSFVIFTVNHDITDNGEQQQLHVKKKKYYFFLHNTTFKQYIFKIIQIKIIYDLSLYYIVLGFCNLIVTVCTENYYYFFHRLGSISISFVTKWWIKDHMVTFEIRA